MSNRQVAEAISQMDNRQQAKIKNGLIGLIFKCLALISILVAVGLFLKMDGDQSDRDRFVNEGMVSKGLILDKNMSTTTLKNKKGQTRSYETERLYVTYDPESTVKYADLGNTIQEAELPAPSQPDAEQSNTASLTLSEEAYASVDVGDTVAVVRTPYGNTQLVSEIRDYSPDGLYLWIAILAGLGIILGLVGWRIGKK